jgi:hypothetical protein
MGSDALVALYAPSQLAPYVSLPSKAGGSTGYYSPTVNSDGTSSWVETAVAGCKFLLSTFARHQLTTSDRHTFPVHPAHDVQEGTDNVRVG